MILERIIYIVHHALIQVKDYFVAGIGSLGQGVLVGSGTLVGKGVGVGGRGVGAGAETSSEALPP